jgi:hypothetical protein
MDSVRVEYQESMLCFMDPSTLTMAIDQDVMTMKVRSVTLADHCILTKF